MDRDEFRKLGHEIIDWIDDYLAEGYDGPVRPLDAEPGDFLARLPEQPPEAAESGEAILKDFHDLVMPRVTHWNDPRFYAYFPSNNSRAGTLGDLLGSGLSANCMSWATSPAGTELEVRMLEWLGSMIGLPWPGCIQDTASTATIVAVLSAREKAAPIKEEGYYGRKPLTVYTSEHANTVIMRACWIAGIGEKYLREIPGDPETFAMDADILEARIKEDVAAGYQPMMVCTTVGTTSSTAIDPVARVAELCQEYGMWQHVDAAWAGSAAILPELRDELMDGVLEADSFCFNPHKWLYTNFDCAAYFCKNPFYLKKALSIQPVFLDTAYDGAAENLRNWSLQLGRRFRALKLWWVIRSFGVSGLQEKIRLHLRMGETFAQKVVDHPRLTLVLPPKLALVCFHAESDAITERLLEEINKTGDAFLTQTRLNGRYIIRVAFGQGQSKFEQVDTLFDLVCEKLEGIA